jgi:outer membrane protein, multidrug efflux system
MKRFICYDQLMCALGLVLAGCGHSTDVTIPAKPLPVAFERQAAGRSVAAMNWRAYFGDDDLNRLISSALAVSPDVHMALQRIEIARASVRQSTGALMPQVSAGAGAGVQKVGRYTTEGAGNATTEITQGQPVPTHVGDFAVGLQASWEIDAWGKLRNQRQSAVSQYLATVEGKNLIVTALIADIAAAYFELVALDHARDVLAQTVVRQQEALEVVRLQKLAGRANELAVQQFQAQLVNTKALAAENLLLTNETENRINLLRGVYPERIVRTKNALNKDVASSVSAGVPSELLESRPDIREAELLLEAAKCDLRAARAAFFPSINIGAGVGFQAFNPKFLFSTPESLVYSATVGLVAPLVNRSGIEAQFDAAKAYQIQAMYNYQKVILNAYVEVADGLSRLEGSAKLVALKKEQKAAVVETIDTADTLYRAGQASYFEVLMAQQNTLSADLELIETMKSQHLASIRVYKALGGGWR